MALKLDYNNMMKESIGNDGFTCADFDKIKPQIENAFNAVKVGAGKWWRLSGHRDRENRR